jgi:(1->4)-alpha-D-glucan 1-alpha-D-glucosylmutase
MTEIDRTDAPALPVAAPRATYRVQFHAGFRFSQATELVPYLDALGVSHLYASSYLKARQGSQHGYDIVDHNALNPEVGDTDDHARLCAALEAHRMSQVLDIVPNHMGVLASDNPWWADVVESGPASPWSDTFDIDWAPSGPRLDGQVLLPILGDQYGEVLERGELALAFRPATGALVVAYFDHEIPVRPQEWPRLLDLHSLPPQAAPEARRELVDLLDAFGRLPLDSGPRDARLRSQRERMQLKARLAAWVGSQPWAPAWIEQSLARLCGTPGEPATFDALHRLIERQPWRLAYWRVGADEVNYRRFFEVSTLAAVRMEDPAVFRETHTTILRWVAEGKLTALRVDHPDGLAEPRQYFERLQHAVTADRAAAGQPERPLYLAIEKILANHEHWPADWPVHGDTGYRFSNLVNGLFVDERNQAAFDALYAGFIGRVCDYPAELLDAKRYVIFHLLASDLHALTDAAFRIAQRSRRTRDFTYNGIRSALVELAAGMPVYRTYIGAEGVHDIDRRHLGWAVSAALARGALTEGETIAYLAAMMLNADEPDAGRLGFVRRFQQFTSPVMAKAMEDTAFYRYHRLASLNDVGGDPETFGIGVKAFHGANRARARHMPHCMLGTSTHDSKRSEDLRARLDVLSEMPDEWAAALGRWRELRLRQLAEIEGAPALHPNDEMLLFQTLVGAWPMQHIDDAALADFRERIQAYMLKALREAKQLTSWLRPDEAYEAEVARSIDALLGRLEPNPFLTDLRAFVAGINPFGCANSLSTVALKLTSPGLPDVYQGCETWNLSLVDPDNRRPVDFATLQTQLQVLREAWAPEQALSPQALRELNSTWEDGRPKLLVTWRLLQLRAGHADLMADGGYQEIEATGPAAAHVVAYARTDPQGAASTLTVATRLLKTLYRDAPAPDGLRFAVEPWQGTEIACPVQDGAPWHDVILGRVIAPTQRDGTWWLPLTTLLNGLPVAQLYRGPKMRMDRAGGSAT